jgi:hypothetical protein
MVGGGRGSASRSIGTSILLAVVVFLFLCPPVSGAPLPTAGAQTTLELAPALRRSMHRGRVKVVALAPATVEGATMTFPGKGSVDPITGQISITCEGGLAFRRGRRVVRMGELELDTAGGSLEANLGSGEMGVATTSFVAGSEGFGTRAGSNALHLTGAVAHLLRVRLHLPPKHRRPRAAAGGRRRHDVAKRRSKRVFTRGRSLGTVSVVAQPGTVAIVPGGDLTIVLDPTIAAKLRDVEVHISGGAPIGGSEPDLFHFEVTGGSFELASQALSVAGGAVIRFALTLETAGVVVAESEVSVGDPSVELPSATLKADLVGKSDAVPYLGFGDLGPQTVIGDLLGPTSAFSVDQSARRVALLATPVVITPVAAQALDGFRKLCENRERESKPQDEIKAGEPLGSVSFSAQAE